MPPPPQDTFKPKAKDKAAADAVKGKDGGPKRNKESDAKAKAVGEGEEAKATPASKAAAAPATKAKYACPARGYSC